MRPNRPGPIPGGLIGTILIVLAVEGAVGGYVGRELRFEGRWVWNRAAKEAGQGPRVLCFGDSQIKNGVFPAIVEAKTGKTTYNLAMNGSQVPASYFLLRRAIEHGARPEAVVVGFNPALLSRGCDRRSALWLGLVGPRDWIGVAGWREKPFQAAETTLDLLSPSIRERAEIRAGLLGSLKGEPNAAGSPFTRAFLNAFQDRNWSVNRGAQVLPDYNVPRDPAPWYRHDYPAPWAIDPTIASYLGRFLKLAESHQIRVYWLLHPVDPEGQALIDSNGQEDRFGRFLDRTLKRHENLVLIDGHHSYYDRSAFTDMVHLHDRGASTLSLALADILRGPIPASRIIPLPPYRPTAPPPTLEPLSRTIVALQEAEKAARIR